MIRNYGKLTSASNAGGVLNITTPNDLTVEDNSVLKAEGALSITAPNLTISTGASIDLTGKGYLSAAGDGAGGSTGDYVCCGGGAGYGGNGGNGYCVSGGNSYGSLDVPTDLGSGGGTAYGTAGGNGGGAIKLTVSGTLSLDGGSINANGNVGASAYGSAGGGGSGGSILIISGNVVGTGSIEANGGNGGHNTRHGHYGGGGSGGRIAIHYTTKTLSNENITAIGGTGQQAGGAGTIYWKSAGPVKPVYSFFIGYSATTNFSNVTSLTNVTNVTLGIPQKGKIKFSADYGINSDDEDYNANVKIENSLIYVNLSALHSSFNHSATLTFYNVDCGFPYVYYSETAYTKAEIIAENNQCLAPRCTNIQCSSGTLTVDVAHFSGYAVNGTSNLTIDADDPKYPLELVTFTAEYMNSTGLIAGATCNISFSDGSYIMNERADNIYNYSRTFASIQIVEYNVTCSATGENTVFANDTAVIGDIAIPEFSVLTLGLGLIAVLAGLVVIRNKRRIYH